MPDRMSHRLQLPCQPLRPWAGLHPHQYWLRTFKERKQRIPAEWRCGDLQRQVPRRVPEPRMVSFACGGEGDHRDLAAPLQRGASTLEPRLSHAVARLPKAASRHATGQDARCASLRALARCMTGSARSTCMKYGTPSQANPGPKNPGRSVSSGTDSVPVDTFDRVRDPVYECP